MTLASGVLVVIFLGQGCGQGSRLGWWMRLQHSILDLLSSKIPVSQAPNGDATWQVGI